MSHIALKICLAVHAAGGIAYYTGGAVRDMLLGRESKDIDIEVFGLGHGDLIDVLNSVCSKVDYVGAQYGIFKADGIDVGFPRRDKSHGKGAETVVDSSMTVEEAARRRDLTVNAIYFDPITLKIVDPYGGWDDLEEGRLKCVNEETFHEDPLRPLRAARLGATHKLRLMLYGCIDVCRRADKEKVAKLPAERVMGELEKVLLTAETPYMFFQDLEHMGLLSHIFPELASMRAVEQGKKYHPEGNVLSHTMLALNSVPVKDRTLDVMLAILFHDLGKSLVPNVVEDDHISFKGHAEALDNAKKALARLTNEKELTESVLSLVYFHMRPYQFKDGFTKKAVRRLAASVDFPKLMVVHRADRAGRGFGYRESSLPSIEEMLRMYDEIANEIKPLLQGRDLIALGYTPGLDLGKVLKILYDHQLDGDFTTKEEGVKFVQEDLMKKS